jgi:hypothetical protein
LTVAIVGVTGTLLGAVITQLLSARRERQQWKRQVDRDDEKWQRERVERQDQWNREDAARIRQVAAEAYATGLEAAIWLKARQCRGLCR